MRTSDLGNCTDDVVGNSLSHIPTPPIQSLGGTFTLRHTLITKFLQAKKLEQMISRSHPVYILPSMVPLSESSRKCVSYRAQGRVNSTVHAKPWHTNCFSNVFDSTILQWVLTLPRGPSLPHPTGQAPYGEKEDWGFTLGLGLSPLPRAHCSCFIFRLPLELRPSL